MPALDTLRQIAADPTGRNHTARQVIEARLGRPLGPLATMPPDLRQALKMLAIQKCRKE